MLWKLAATARRQLNDATTFDGQVEARLADLLAASPVGIINPYFSFILFQVGSEDATKSRHQRERPAVRTLPP